MQWLVGPGSFLKMVLRLGAEQGVYDQRTCQVRCTPWSSAPGCLSSVTLSHWSFQQIKGSLVFLEFSVAQGLDAISARGSPEQKSVQVTTWGGGEMVKEGKGEGFGRCLGRSAPGLTGRIVLNSC